MAFSTGVWRELRDNSATQWCNVSIAEDRLLAPEGKRSMFLLWAEGASLYQWAELVSLQTSDVRYH